MEDIDAQEGETPRFAVVVEGKPLPDIMWYKVGWVPATSSRPPDPRSLLPSAASGSPRWGFGFVSPQLMQGAASLPVVGAGGGRQGPP